MHCLICHEEGTTTPAIGICVQCGAGCCEKHSTMTTSTRSVPTGNVLEQARVKTRALTCERCLSLASHAPA